LYVGLAANVAGGVDKLTSATGVVSVAAATAPSVGQVLMATSGTVATWQTPATTNLASPGPIGNTTPSTGAFTTVTTTTSVAVGGSTLSGSGSGVQFPATQSASTDANTLDDYEEGTWTPNVGGSATYTTQTGNYTKIGRVVVANFYLAISAIGTGSTFRISGLPFATGGSGIGMGGCLVYWYFLTQNVTSFAVQASGSDIDIYSSLAAGTNVTNNSIFGNSSIAAGTIVYKV
jgi:hypothetical protein